MREIPLTQGRVAIVDDEDYEALARNKWCAIWRRATFYARRNVRLANGRRTTIYIHRQIIGAGPDIEIDHWNRNGLDNRRENLRIATGRENNQNRGKHACASSRFKGVHWNKRDRKWTANIRHGVPGPTGMARLVHLGYYDDEESAAHAYDGAALASFGEFACLNFPEVKP